MEYVLEMKDISKTRGEREMKTCKMAMAAKFINRGGRIPAPIQSLKN